jgi:hypothetical protein
MSYHVRRRRATKANELDHGINQGNVYQSELMLHTRVTWNGEQRFHMKHSFSLNGNPFKIFQCTRY